MQVSVGKCNHSQPRLAVELPLACCILLREPLPAPAIIEETMICKVRWLLMYEVACSTRLRRNYLIKTRLSEFAKVQQKPVIASSPKTIERKSVHLLVK